MNKLNKLIYIFGLSMIILIGCSDSDDEVTNIEYDRLFSPTEVGAKIINRTNIRLTWNAVSNADGYNIEVYANGDMSFEGTPALVLTGIVERPYTIEGLEGDMDYSVRIQSMSASIASSKWVGVVGGKTDSEQIFKPVAEEDVTKTEVTLRWAEGQTATEIIIEPTNIKHTVTASEIAAGVATISGLTHGTKYKATLLNGTKVRGAIEFETKVDGIPVRPDDDLAALIADATDGDIFAVYPGSYKLGKIPITKNISIVSVSQSDKAILNAMISLEAGVSLELKDVILDGTEAVEPGKNADQAIQFNTADAAYGDITISGCEIRNYLKGLLYFNVKAMAESITFNNCLIYNIECNGGDFFDCRKGTAKQINFTNSTVYNSVGARDMFRIDNDNSSAFSSVPKLLVDRNTFYNVVNDKGKRMLYLRWVGNEVTFTNNIVANSLGALKHNASNIISISKNNYLNAEAIAGADSGGTTLDPQFTDAANGNFKVNNIDVDAGDPRWLN